MGRKKKIDTEVNETTNASNPELVEQIIFEVETKPIELSLDLGRQDLNENFTKIQEKINEIIKKG